MTTYRTFIFALLTLFCISCKKEKIEHKSDFEKSYHKWLEFKKTTGNTYQYQTVFVSWVGYAAYTTISVSNGTVIKRSFHTVYMPDYNGPVLPDGNWVEEAGEINTHPGTAQILDEIYAECLNNWLKKRDDVTTYFEAKNNGLISSCGYVSKNCADDCFRGISISYIRTIDEIR